MPIEIKQNEPLAKHSTYAIGGPARYFAVAKTKEDVLEALAFAKEKNLPFFALGGGSNILFGDEGYGGVIIKIQIGGIKIDGEKITAGAGVPLTQLMNVSADNGLSGLEWAVGIPGNIGGAVNGNAGAYGRSISETVESILVLEENNLGVWEVKKYTHQDCGFRYRESGFKKKDNRKIILEVSLEFKKGEKEKIKKTFKYILITRKGKVPPQPSAGCVFKNLKKENGELISSAGALIDQCGLKGRKIGKAEVPALHGNYVVNMGGATAEDVRALISLCKEKVKEKFNLELEEEIIVM